MSRLQESAQIAALIARMNATIAGVEAMKADNAMRAACDNSPAYVGSDFLHEADNLNAIAGEMQQLAEVREHREPLTPEQQRQIDHAHRVYMDGNVDATTRDYLIEKAMRA